MRATLERWRKPVDKEKFSDMPIPPSPAQYVERPLSRQAQQAIEAHYVEVTTLAAERDKARADLESAKQLVTQATHRISGLAEEISQLKSRCAGYQLERDEAVAKFAKLEAVMISIRATMDALDVPHKLPEQPVNKIPSDLPVFTPKERIKTKPAATVIHENMK